MTVFIELETDPFVETAEEERLAGQVLQKPVRRPLRGIQVKPDTYAYFKVIDKYGNVIPLMDAGGEMEEDGTGMTSQFTNFLVQSFSQGSTEKQQIVPTFGDDYIFFYGKQPQVYQISGVLMNTYDFKWATEFWYNYENYLRGTRLVDNHARIYFYCDGILLEGYLLSAQANREASTRNTVPFGIQMFVIKEHFVESVGNPWFPRYPEEEATPTGTAGIFAKIQAGFSIASSYAATGQAALGSTAALVKGDMQASISGSFSILSGAFARSGPVRSKIKDNWDEYIGAPGPEKAGKGFWAKFSASFSFAAGMHDDFSGYLDASGAASWGPIMRLESGFATGTGSQYGDYP